MQSLATKDFAKGFGYITKVTRSANGVKIAGSASDIKPDMYRSVMTLGMYKNWVRDFKKNPEIPFSISHYRSIYVGQIDRLWVDGNYLKFTGEVVDTPISEKLVAKLLDEELRQHIGFSIGCAPTDFYFDEKQHNLLYYTDGTLRHVAFTTIPANPRVRGVELEMRAKSQFEDARELIGEAMASWLVNEEKKLYHIIPGNILSDYEEEKRSEYSPKFLQAIYDYLKNSGEISKEDWDKAMKHARGVAGGKSGPKKGNVDLNMVLAKILGGVSITSLDDNELLAIHDKMHQLVA